MEQPEQPPLAQQPVVPAQPSVAIRASRAFRWAVIVGVAALAIMGLVLLYLLTQATTNRDLYERNYALLLNLNVAVAGLLVLVIGWMVVRLSLRLYRKRFGSRLLVKLAAIFALVGLLPGLMIYVVSYQFVSRSIESWFDVQVEGALVAGLNLGRVTLDTLATDLANKTRQAATQLAEAPDATAGLALERLRDNLSASDVVLWSASSQVIASVGDSRFSISPERPSTQQLRNARNQRVATQIEGLEEAAVPGALAGGQTPAPHIKAIAIVNNPNVNVLGSGRFLQVSVTLPTSLVANAIAVQEANREYQERAMARTGLRKMYIGTLTLSLFLAIFGAVLLAVVLGNQLARPLLVLAEGVRQVAQGDLTPKAALRGKDELGGLTRSFADMTQQLFDARAAVQHSMAQVDAARSTLQTLVDNLTSGVIVLDSSGTIESANLGAGRILHLPLDDFLGKQLQNVPGLHTFAIEVMARFADYFGGLQPAITEPGAGQTSTHWQQSFELHAAPHGTLPTDGKATITLIARGVQMPGASHYLLVFDDVSDMVSAQRAQAWGEVARRLAHEIKNPLTPIQLSAERLEMKLSGKLADSEQALLVKSVKTIVDQVEAMKRLVNEFRDYGRLPAADLKILDLNALVADVGLLYVGTNAAGHPLLRIELDTDAPPIRGDAQQLRQVLHNLVQNAQDAQEGSPTESIASHPVLIKTAFLSAQCRVVLSVCDNGTGFSDAILRRAFEPYVTTKSKGTGLGLAVVKKIADEHGARVEVSNRIKDGQIHGAQVSLSFAAVV